jgi:SAM-dependent methyltransferase
LSEGARNVTNAYDRVRYPNSAVARTHPANLSVFAALFGRPFAPFAKSRVLEIGCGEGVNLINMALCAPGSEFVGVDLAETPTNLARATVQALGLANVRFHVQDIAHTDDSLGSFDYIIAHGVYAWVPAAVGEALIRVVGALLRPDGLAFISYNAYPGARFRQILRDLLLSATDAISDPVEKLRLAHSVLIHATKSWSESDPYQNALRAAANYMLKRPPEVLFHDEFSAYFEPKLLSDVIAAARKVGLDYLCDSQPPLSAEALFPSEKFAAAEPYSGGDWGRFEQLGDFSEMRFFRQSIFYRGGGVDRRLVAQRLAGLWAYGDPRPVEGDPQTPETFVFATPQGAQMTTNSPKLAQVITRIGAAFPCCVPLDDVAEDADLASYVLRLFVANVVRLRTAPFSFTLTPGDHPIASPLARLQAAQGEEILASLLHTSVVIDAGGAEILSLMDGSRTRGDLAREVAALASVSPEIGLAQASKAVTQMAGLGLIVA